MTSMKTSLIINDHLFREAQKVSLKEKRTVSDTINEWARAGYDLIRKKKRALRSHARRIPALNLGGPAQVDFNSRRQWMDELDNGTSGNSISPGTS